MYHCPICDKIVPENRPTSADGQRDCYCSDACYNEGREMPYDAPIPA
jgi:hypothetical protein